ncbi:MAG: TrpR YerC/YecD [Clostridia bacterium]|nr:TrpR YerC/YecD [Clostridia bacterium]
MTEHHPETEAVDSLVKALLSLQSEEECRAFLSDLCTIRELSDLSQRFEVAKLLKEGKNYQDISKQTGASTATISRVNRALVYGTGGYRTVLSRSEH